MTVLKEINLITAAIFAAFFIPILLGTFQPLSRGKLQHSFEILLNNLEFLFGLMLSVYFTKRIFFENKDSFFRHIFEAIPESIRATLYSRDVLTYMTATPIILLLVLLILRIITTPLYKFVIVPLSESMYEFVYSMNTVVRRIFSALWSLPRALFYVLIFSLLLNFYSYYFPSQLLSRWMNQSPAYQLVYRNALYPILNSNIAKTVPVLVNDSFRRSIGHVIPGVIDQDRNFSPGKLAEQISRGNITIIEYFNGVTLEEAIKSNDEIDAMAEKIVGNEKDSSKKAYSLYKWISSNVKYDYDKATAINSNAKGISSGAIIAFNTRKGICFDYSSLYISMCRAVGLKVRMITGLGYSGVSWGDHAWNQVYSDEDKSWINVDTTFGTAGNYFDKDDFAVDHKYAEVQGEW